MDDCLQWDGLSGSGAVICLVSSGMLSGAWSTNQSSLRVLKQVTLVNEGCAPLTPTLRWAGNAGVILPRGWCVVAAAGGLPIQCC